MNLSKSINPESSNNTLFSTSSQALENKRIKLSFEDVKKLTNDSIKQGRPFVELPQGADLSELFSLNSGYYDEKQISNGNKIKYPDLHMIVGENSILPSRMNNCSIADGCIAPSNVNMNNCVVYGTLFLGSTNSYQGGTARIKNSVLSNLSSIGGGLVVAKNCTFSNISCRILKIRETPVKQAFIEDKLILDGLNIVLNAYVGDTVEWIGQHNIMGGNLVVMGKNGKCVEFNDEKGTLSHDNSNKIVIGNINLKRFGFMPSEKPIEGKNRFAIQPLSMHGAKEGDVVLPVNVFNQLSSAIDRMCFSKDLTSVPLQSFLEHDSINTNINNYQPKPEVSNSVSPSV
jgi:hypothetical protein